jgi:molybdate transport system substrate-binding protein
MPDTPQTLSLSSLTEKTLRKDPMKLRQYLGATALLFSWLFSTANAAEVSVAVAANFTAPMTRIAAAFEQDTGHKVSLAFGSTGKLAAQIKNGAPFQILLAADQETPALLEQEKLTLAGSRFTYATGKLVLWSKQEALVDKQGDILRKGTFEKIAIADPKLAPYGAAAMEVMEKMGVRQTLQAKLVQGENISTAYQWVNTGNAQLGFVALSQIMVNGQIANGSAWVIPASLHAPLHQDAVALRNSLDNPAATALLVYLKGEKARAIGRSYGYEY